MTRTQSELALATVQDRTLALTHTLSVATNLCKRVLALVAVGRGEKREEGEARGRSSPSNKTASVYLSTDADATSSPARSSS